MFEFFSSFSQFVQSNVLCIFTGYAEIPRKIVQCLIYEGRLAVLADSFGSVSGGLDCDKDRFGGDGWGELLCFCVIVSMNTV